MKINPRRNYPAGGPTNPILRIGAMMPAASLSSNLDLPSLREQRIHWKGSFLPGRGLESATTNLEGSSRVLPVPREHRILYFPIGCPHPSAARLTNPAHPQRRSL